MDDPSRTLFALALAALWCGFALHGLARQAARSPQWRDLLARLRRAGPIARAAALALLVAVIAIGGTKPGGGNGDGGLLGMSSVPPAPPPEPAFGLVEVRTQGVAMRAEPTNAVEAAAWRLRGASEDGIWIERESPFFALGTNPVRRVYASASGALSFESSRHPPLGTALPDGTGLPALAPFRAPLGILPTAVEGTNAAPSRLWHAPAPGGGLLVAWENVAPDRLPARRATIQAELKPNGDFTYRYDFHDELDPPATNFAIGAQAGTNGVNALAILGTNLLAETVWRVDGGIVASGVPVAQLLCTNGALRTPARFALEWRNVAEIGSDGSADTDGDGLSDQDEVFRLGTDPRRYDTDGDGLADGAEALAGADPRDADEDGDGIPDGADAAAWTANSLWGGNTVDGTRFCVTLGTAIPQGEAATILIGSLSIPLRAPRSYALSIPRGVLVPFRLFSTCENPVDLSIGGAAAPQRADGATRNGSDHPIWTDDPGGVFDGEACGGAGNLASPVLHLVDETGSEAEDFCLHNGLDLLAKSWTFSVEPAEIGLTLGEMFVDGFSVDGPATVSLRIQRYSSDSASGTVSLAPPKLRHGWAYVSRSIHRCLDDHLEWCYACDMYHDPDNKDACPHEEECPAKTDPTAECTCPIPVIRANGPGGPSSVARVRFPIGGLCCCSGDLVPPFVRITHIDGNLQITNASGTVAVSDIVSGPAGIRATGLSGANPSEVKYDIVHRHYDDSGSVTNEATTNVTMKVWAVDILHEPVTTETVGGLSVNPSGIVTGRTARFRLSIAPTNFPSELVSWTAAPANRVSFPSGTNGTEVVVRGDAAGDETLTAHITGYAGPPPICEAKVVPETVVPVHAFIICSTNGTPCRTVSDIQSLLFGANQIYAQVGRRFYLASHSFITNQSWLSIAYQSGTWPRFYQIVNYTNHTGGIEMYFNNSIENAVGLTVPDGVLIATNGTARTTAHELGHAQHLPDIYVSWPTTSLVVTGLVGKARLPGDWGSPSLEGYYPSRLHQADLIRRLTMYGYDLPDARDFSAGNIDGLWYPVFTSNPFRLSPCPVGFFTNATLHPISN